MAAHSDLITWALLAVAALTFSLLAGVIEGLSARRQRRRLQARASPVLHPLTQHRPRRVRQPFSWHVLRYVGYFFGFLLVAYLSVLFLKTVYAIIADWL